MLFGLASMSAYQHAAVWGQEDGRGGVRTELGDTTVKVEADGASTAEIIEHLAGTLGFEISGDFPNKDVRLTRKLEGTLDELLAELLHGVSYVLVSEAGAPRRLVVLSAVPEAPGRVGAMSVEQLRQKENELVMQIAQFEDFRQEARERANPGLAKKFELHIKELSREMKAIRTRLPH